MRLDEKAFEIAHKEFRIEGGPDSRRLKAAIRAYFAAAPASTVSNEWVMVPRTPTVAMLQAAGECFARMRETHRGGATGADYYRAMLAAAPAPTVSGAAKPLTRPHSWLDANCRMRPDGLYFDAAGNLYRPASDDEAQYGLNDTWPGDPIPCPEDAPAPAVSGEPVACPKCDGTGRMQTELRGFEHCTRCDGSGTLAALRKVKYLVAENQVLRSRLAEAERVCDSYAAENQRLFDKAEAAEAELAKAREALARAALPPTDKSPSE